MVSIAWSHLKSFCVIRISSITPDNIHSDRLHRLWLRRQSGSLTNWRVGSLFHGSSSPHVMECPRASGLNPKFLLLDIAVRLDDYEKILYIYIL